MGWGASFASLAFIFALSSINVSTTVGGIYPKAVRSLCAACPTTTVSGPTNRHAAALAWSLPAIEVTREWGAVIFHLDIGVYQMVEEDSG